MRTWRRRVIPWLHFAICVAPVIQNQVTDVLTEDSAPGPRLLNVVATVFAGATVLFAPHATHLVQPALSLPDVVAARSGSTPVQWLDFHAVLRSRPTTTGERAVDRVAQFCLCLSPAS